MAESSFSDRVVEVIKRIPAGKVATYGQVARLAGDAGGTRQVVWTLSSRSEAERLPWHRVLNSKGKISLPGEGGEIQRALLEQEGIRFNDKDAVPLDVYGWRG